MDGRYSRETWNGSYYSRNGDKQAKLAYDVLCKYKEALEQGKSARTVTFETKEEQKIAHELFLLTSKPVLYLCNVDEKSAVNGNKYVEAVREAVKDENAQILVVAAKIESEIAEFETYEERQMFLQEVGLEESGVSRLIRAATALLRPSIICSPCRLSSRRVRWR